MGGEPQLKDITRLVAEAPVKSVVEKLCVKVSDNVVVTGLLPAHKTLGSRTEALEGELFGQDARQQGQDARQQG